MTQKYGSTVKNLTLTFLPAIFLGVPIYVEGPTFHRGTSKLIVTVTITVAVTGVKKILSSKIGQNLENYFFDLFKEKWKGIYSGGLIFNIY